MKGAVKEKRRAQKRQHIDPSDYRTPMQSIQVRIDKVEGFIPVSTNRISVHNN